MLFTEKDRRCVIIPDLVLEEFASAKIADGLDPLGLSPILKSPTQSVSPTIINSRKSLRTSEMSIASQKENEGDNLVIEAADPSLATSSKKGSTSYFPHDNYHIAPDSHRSMTLCYIPTNWKLQTYFSLN